MRTVTYGGAVSLDGYLAGAGGAIDWLHFSRDVQEVTAGYWKNVDAILMGRKTYDVARAQGHSGGSSTMRTYVFSRTLTAIDEAGVELVKDDAVGFVRSLKAQKGNGICLMGGGELAGPLIAAGLVDEIGLNIHPILLGSGIPTFRDISRRVALTLVEARTLDGGCVLARYAVR
jgi:dihydrofolate reductase